MSNLANLWGGFQSDEDESLKISGSGISFGLNSAVTLEKFEYSTKTGAGGSDGNPALIIEINVGGTTKNTRIWDPTVEGGKVYYRGKEVLDKNSPEYALGLTEAVKQAKAMITHYVKASGKSKEVIEAAYAVPVSSFEQLVAISSALLTDTIAGKKPLDVFMQYQSKITGTAEQTYPEIPSNLAYGSFITPHIAPVGSWKEERNWEEKDEQGNTILKSGIRYVDDAGNVHRFQRDDVFMKSKVASQQFKAQSTAGAAMNSGAPTGTPTAQKSAW